MPSSSAATRRRMAQPRAVVDVVAAESRCAPASGTGRPLRCCPWPSRSRRAPSGRARRGCARRPAAGELERFFPGRFAEDVEHAVRVHRRSRPRLGASARRISGLRQALRVVRVVEAVAALDAQAAVVGRAVAAVDVEDLVVLDVVGQLAADAAVRAHRVDLLVGHGAAPTLARRHQRAGRAGLHALAAGDAGGRAHRVVHVEHDLRVRRRGRPGR